MSAVNHHKSSIKLLFQSLFVQLLFVARSHILNPFKTNGISIMFDTVWSIVYNEGSQVILSKKYYISSYEDRFCINKQCRP